MTDNPLIGRLVTAIYLAADGGAIRFDTDAGEIVARADGDCCSHTWIEAVEGAEAAIGHRVLAVEDLDLPRSDERTDDGDVIAFYGCKITTDGGDVVLDYRNESNGYYGGNLAWTGDYFYGGVFGQNRSTQKWRKLA